MTSPAAKRPYLSTAALLTLAVIAVIGGLLGASVWYSLMGPAIPLFAFLGPVGWFGISGVYMIAPVLAGLLVCRPGAPTLYGVVQGFVEMLFGNPSGAVAIVLAGLQGLGTELSVSVFGYRPGLPAALLAGALGSVLSNAAWLVINGPITLQSVLVGGLTSAVSGALLGGLIAWLLAQALQRAGVVSRLGLPRYEEL